MRACAQRRPPVTSTPTNANCTTLLPSNTQANPANERGWAFMWHSHNEREITTNNVFPGGMLMMLLVDSREFVIDESDVTTRMRSEKNHANEQFQNQTESRSTNTGSILPFAAVAAFGQQTINLTAAPTSMTLPDGTIVPMWGYFCGAAVTGSTATCAALNPASAATARNLVSRGDHRSHGTGL